MVRRLRQAQQGKGQMKIILMLIVALMLAGCGSCGGRDMRLPLTINSGHSQKR